MLHATCYILERQFILVQHVAQKIKRILTSPAAEVGNPASLDKVFFSTDYFSLGYMQ